MSRDPRPKPESKPNYSAPALDKGLDILEVLADHPEGMTQRELAKALGRSVSEIFRMLDCLNNRDYIALHKPADVYALSLKLFELAHRHPPMQQLIKEALPLMTDVARELDQSCHLAVCHNNRILIVAQVDSPAGIGLSVRMGTQLDLLQAASGMVILAFQSAEERKHMLSAQALTNEQELNAEVLEEEFAVIRKRGYEEADSFQVKGVKNISFPVLDFSGHARAALTVPFLRRIDYGDTPKRAEARGILKEAALKLSNAIGSQA